ncbi:hypothetical protein BD410DRAFT_550158 [Rickenella mellea]|uniref:Threonine/Serine exporter ThrE domain-containing protein n=1 Tax=Rickenella mellea TaxID=50990 RepID=A0A4Y7PPL1_9AGAM|nr:hypothetical protein BD410DRAFT_550158 [Rickenella mellea]
MFFQRMVSRAELSSSGSDIVSAGIVSFASRAIASRAPNHSFSSSAVTGLLPGSLILSCVLDIASRNLTLRAPKITAGLLTSLYLVSPTSGRASTPSRASNSHTAPGWSTSCTDSSHPPIAPPRSLLHRGPHRHIHILLHLLLCRHHHRARNQRVLPGPLQPVVPPWSTLIFMLSIYNFCSSMKGVQKRKTVPMVVMVMISCVSSGLTRYVNIKLGLGGHPDYVSLIGSFVVSALGNLCSRKIGGMAFTIMLTGMLLLIPTGLAEAGGLSNSYTGPGEDEYTNSLELARKMISVIIGVMSGVYLSARIIYSFGKKKNSALVTF